MTDEKAEAANTDTGSTEASEAPGQALPKDFLNPKSMLTPGVCGGITMLITNALVAQFGAPANYTGLIVSCLLGAIVFASTAAVWWLRGVYWILNSLIIFSIALGTNQIGTATASVSKAATTNTPPPNIHITPVPLKRPFFASWLNTEKHHETPVETAAITTNHLWELSSAVAEYYSKTHAPRATSISTNEIFKVMTLYLATNKSLSVPRIYEE